jgi:hypothetical protein
MKLRNSLFVSACCCLISAAALAQTASDQARDAGNKIGDTLRGAPSTQPDKVNAPDAEDIRSMLAKATEQAFDKNGFDNLTSRFVDADRNRIKQAKLTDSDWDKLNGRIDQIRKDWKAKYNQDFDSGNIQLALDNAGFQVFQGQLFDQARTASEKLTPDVSAADSTNSDNAQAKTADAAGGAADRSANGDPSDKKMATAVVAASHDLPAVSIHLKNEGTVGDSWKIEIPQSLDAQKINDGLQRHLAMITDQKDSWPSDVNDAYRLVSHHVLASLSTTDSMTQPAQDKAGR